MLFTHTSKNLKGEDCIIELISVPGSKENTVALILRVKMDSISKTIDDNKEGSHDEICTSEII